MIIATNDALLVIDDRAVQHAEQRNPQLLDYRLLYDVGSLSADEYAKILTGALDLESMRL